MAIKKKWSIPILLVGLFMVFCVFSSTCYARTTLTDDEAEYLFSQIGYSSGDYFGAIYNNLSYNVNSGNKVLVGTSAFTTFKDYFNTNNTLEIDPNKTLFIIIFEGNWTYVYYGNFNNGKNDGLNHLYFSVRSKDDGAKTLSIYPITINDSKTQVSTTIKRLMFYKSGNTITNFSLSDFSLGFLNVSAKLYTPNKDFNASNFQQGLNVLEPFQGLVSFSPTNSIYCNLTDSFSFGNTDNPSPFLYGENLTPIPDTPDVPSGDSSGDTGNTGTITNPSGEITGNIDLSGIENSLNNIENKIPTSGEISNILSGETNKLIGTLTDNPDLSSTNISSGDITDALDFEFASDPYANFWLELTNGLKNALLGTKRTIDISFQSRTWTIDLDDFAVLPAWLVIIITPFSTVFFVWILVRWWKVILDKITSGNVDSILKENSEERNFQFILKGV